MGDPSAEVGVRVVGARAPQKPERPRNRFSSEPPEGAGSAHSPSSAREADLWIRASWTETGNVSCGLKPLRRVHLLQRPRATHPGVDGGEPGGERGFGAWLLRPVQAGGGVFGARAAPERGRREGPSPRQRGGPGLAHWVRGVCPAWPRALRHRRAEPGRGPRAPLCK